MTKVVVAMHPRGQPRTHYASIIVIPLTGIDTDRQLLLSANLLQLEEVA